VNDMLATMVLDGREMDYELGSTFPTLSHAPITEALIDIQAELLADVDLATLRKFYEGLEDRLPKIDERVSVSATLELKRSGAEMKAKDPTTDGFIMRSESDGLVVQARMNGFTINKLTPYISWKSLSDLGRELWGRYVRIARPTKVTRLAVRYTNRIKIETGRDFKQFILTTPEIAPGIPQGLPEFLMRLVIPHPSGSTAIVTESSLPPDPNEEDHAILLDIDVFRQINMPATDEVAIWSTLEELRAYKNLIFFQTITPAQLEKYK
jgi:uncharacterized protein (TIGR04255 family)